jgi:hypothetical protein
MVAPIVTELRLLLDQGGAPAQALLLDNALGQIDNEDRFFSLLTDGTIWGAAGSVVDTQFPIGESTPVQRRHLARLKLALARALISCGYGEAPGVRDAVETLTPYAPGS